MKLNEIRTFVLTVQLGSFSKVADVLFTTQPSVSKYVSSLEMELGQPLFRREPHMLTLTDFGREFLPYAEAIIQAEVNAETFLNTQSKKPMTFLTLDISETTGNVPSGELSIRLNQALHAFRSIYPDAYVSVRFTPDRELAELVKTQKTDLAICSRAIYGDNASAYNSIRKLTLSTDHNCIICSPELGGTNSVQAALDGAQSISYIHDLVSLDLIALMHAQDDTRHHLRPCINWFNVIADVVENFSVGLIPAVLQPLAEQSGLKCFPLREIQYTTEMSLLFSDVPQRKQCAQFLADCLRQSMEHRLTETVSA